MTTPGSPCMVCGKPMVADNRRVPPDVDCCRCGTDTADDLPAGSDTVAWELERVAAFLDVEPTSSRLRAAAARIRVLEALGNALADRIDDYCCDECRAAIAAWENR